MKNYKLILQEELLDSKLLPTKRKTFEIKYISDDIYDKVLKQTNNEKFMFENMFEKLVDKFIQEKDNVDYIDISKQRTEALNQKAIECLEDIKNQMHQSNESGYVVRFASMNDRDKFNALIDQKISELKGE